MCEYNISVNNFLPMYPYVTVMKKLFFTFILVNMGSDFQMKGL